MQAGDGGDWSVGVVRCDGYVIGFGHCRYFFEFGDAARVADVWLDDAYGV